MFYIYIFMLFIAGVVIGAPIYLVSEFFKERDKKRKEQERTEAILARRHRWSEETCKLLLEKRIRLGMTQEMVSLAWGKPPYVDQEETTAKSKKERWVYGRPRVNARYVWFKNGRVSKIKST